MERSANQLFMEKNRIKIIAVPASQAPSWVREAWVGIEIPLAKPASSPTSCQVGALGGAPSLENLNGYEVHGADALEALRKAGKNDAADWWIEHSALGGGHLVFRKQFCELV